MGIQVLGDPGKSSSAGALVAESWQQALASPHKLLGEGGLLGRQERLMGSKAQVGFPGNFCSVGDSRREPWAAPGCSLYPGDPQKGTGTCSAQEGQRVGNDSSWY